MRTGVSEKGDDVVTVMRSVRNVDMAMVAEVIYLINLIIRVTYAENVGQLKKVEHPIVEN